ncbi:hypothetical protein TNCV_3359881 [Trichonephila clavipes]|nr:hypothetical protein TNCV_3359881 [Trichonephila clavipes]
MAVVAEWYRYRIMACLVTRLRSSNGKGIGPLQACHEFEPSTTEDPPCSLGLSQTYFRTFQGSSIMSIMSPQPSLHISNLTLTAPHQTHPLPLECNPSGHDLGLVVIPSDTEDSPCEGLMHVKSADSQSNQSHAVV